jgi:heavy metal translocating P-type ATPase
MTTGCCGTAGERTGSWWRIAIGAFLAGNSMTIALAVNLSEADPGEKFVLQSIPLAAAVIVTLLLGGEMFRNTWASLRTGPLTVDSLFVVALSGAFSASFVSYFSGTGPVFFEVASILLVIYALGHQLARYTQSRVLSALDDWDPVALTCEVVRGDSWKSSTVADVRKGDRVRVYPGAMIPVDGVVSRGEALVQEVSMTGELLASRRDEGQAVFAGTHVVDSTLEIEATVDGSERCLDRIAAVLREAMRQQGPSQVMADRLARAFVPAVLVAAVGTFVVHNAISGWVPALFNAMAVLLVACPCALGFATPLAVWTGMRRLQALGLYVKRGDAVEKLAAVNRAVFDKTGTLSLPDVASELRMESDWADRRREVEALVSAAEAPVNHPVARVLAQMNPGGWGYSARSVAVEPGRGVSAEVQTSPDAVSRVRISSDAGSPDSASFSVDIDGERAATILLRETKRQHVTELPASLRTIGIDAVMMTGDRTERTVQFAFPSTYASLRPEQKLDLVREWKVQGHCIVFVGDGINDAAAMAVSDVSIAVGREVGLPQEVASIVWPEPAYDRLPKAIQVCRDTVRVIRDNLRFALVYNVLGMAVAACGLLHPVLAVMLMTVSSSVVTLRSLRLLDADEQSRALAGSHAAAS